MNSFILSVFQWSAGIIASLLVVFFSQLINEQYFEPQRKMKELISQVDFTLNYYANIIVNPGEADRNYEVEASIELRKVAMKFMAYLAANPNIK